MKMLISGCLSSSNNSSQRNITIIKALTNKYNKTSDDGNKDDDSFRPFSDSPRRVRV